MEKIEFEGGEFHKIVNPCESEDFTLTYYDMPQKRVDFEKLKHVISHTYGEVVGLVPGRYVVLRDKRTEDVIMSDTYMEIMTNYEIVARATGDVLLGGLGIGLIAYHIQNKPQVRSVTIIEKESQIVDLITRQKILNGKCQIITDDIFQWSPPVGTLYQTIYFDIWNHISEDNWDDMKRLTARFQRRVDRSGDYYFDAWRRDDVRRMVRQQIKYPWFGY